MPRVKSNDPAPYAVHKKTAVLLSEFQQEEAVLQQAEAILRKRMARNSDPLTSPQDAGKMLCMRIGGNAVESLGLMYLDTQHRLIALEELFTGTPDGCRVSIPHIIRQCVQHRATAVILYHNHPSGCTTPSIADESITKAILQALKQLDIAVLDHLIVGGMECTSLRKNNELMFS